MKNEDEREKNLQKSGNVFGNQDLNTLPSGSFKNFQSKPSSNHKTVDFPPSPYLQRHKSFTGIQRSSSAFGQKRK